MKHTFKKVVVLVLAVLMCVSSAMPAFAAATETACPGTGKTHTAHNCTYNVVGDQAATCDADGYVTGQCSTCGAMFKVSETKALGHDWAETAASCDTAAIKTCKVCGKTEAGSAAAGHKWSEWTVNGGVCAIGERRIRTCAVCGLEEKQTMTTEHSWVAGEFVAPVKCTEAGSLSYVCANAGCGATKSEKIWLGAEAGQHNYISWADAVSKKLVEGDDPNAVEPTCAATGVVSKVCENCGKIKTVTVAAKAHKRIDLQFIDPVWESCEANGTHAYFKCYDCGTRYLAKPANKTAVTQVGSNGTTYDAYFTYDYANTGAESDFGAKITSSNEGQLTINDVDHKWVGSNVAATCVTGGYTQRYCALCAKEETATTEPTGHLFHPDVASGKQLAIVKGFYTGITKTSQYKWAVLETFPEFSRQVVAPTCTTDGYSVYKCLNSGCTVESDPVVLARDKKLGHKYDTNDASTIVLTEGGVNVSIAATCTTSGTTAYKCKNNCGIHNYVEVPALGHKTEVIVDVVPTCQTVGKSHVACVRTKDSLGATITCDYKEAAYEVKATENDHSWVTLPGTTKKDPTCTEVGNWVRYCSACTTAVQTYEAPAKGHTYIDIADIDFTKLVKKGDKIMNDAGTEALVEYVQVGGCDKVAIYKLNCKDCAMYSLHEVSEGFNSGSHRVVMVYTNTDNTNKDQYSHLLGDILNEYGVVGTGFSGRHTGNISAPTCTTGGQTFAWYCSNKGCYAYRAVKEGDANVQLITRYGTHFNQEDGSIITYKDVPDERISGAASALDASKIKAPVDENGNITAIAIDIPGTSLVWRYVVEGSCEVDEVLGGGLWCVECGDSVFFTGADQITANVGKLRGHNLVTKTTVNADCQNHGYTPVECTRCDLKMQTNYVEAIDHNMQEVQYFKETCDTNGYKIYQCSVCKVYETVTVSATGHWNISGQELHASCLDAVADRKCIYCLQVIVSDHDYLPTGECKYCGVTKK